MRVIRIVVGFLMTLTLANACTTANHIRDGEGKEAVLIECGSATSISNCHDRAAKECPNGYATISEDSGFNRKEIRVRCK